MTIEECKQERDQLMAINGIATSGIGFICTGGFESKTMNDFILLNGDNLYDMRDEVL